MRFFNQLVKSFTKLESALKIKAPSHAHVVLYKYFDIRG